LSLSGFYGERETVLREPAFQELFERIHALEVGGPRRWVENILALFSGSALDLKAVMGLFPENFGVVVPGKVFRSSRAIYPIHVRSFLRKGIRTDLDFARPHRRTKGLLDASGIQVHRYAVHGAEIREEAFWFCLGHLFAPRQGALVINCAAGCDRTGYVCYLLDRMINGYSARKALHRMLRHGFHFRTKKNIKENLVRFDPDRLAAEFRQKSGLDFETCRRQFLAGETLPSSLSERLLEGIVAPQNTECDE